MLHLQEPSEVFQGFHLCDSVDEVSNQIDNFVLLLGQLDLLLKSADLVPYLLFERQVSLEAVVRDLEEVFGVSWEAYRDSLGEGAHPLVLLNLSPSKWTTTHQSKYVDRRSNK